jgi:pantoate--beta-alanine ligase
VGELRSFTEIADLRTAVTKLKSQGKIIGLVPTMGNLHAGHLKLVAQARQQCDWVICSIFVNPMQFGPGEDLESYPRTLDQDKAGLLSTGCDCLFYPSISEIYPQGLRTQTVVAVPELGTAYCGSSRPGHFDGVTTVVSKLFHICQPDIAFFGLKDYQQYLIIQKMVSDLLFPVALVGVETEREADGLAISSRNNYLTPAQRRLAPTLYLTLQATRAALTAGDRDFIALQESGCARLREAGLQPDYLAISNATTLEPAGEDDRNLVILGAAFLGRARLIDNVRVTLQER